MRMRLPVVNAVLPRRGQGPADYAGLYGHDAAEQWESLDEETDTYSQQSEVLVDRHSRGN